MPPIARNILAVVVGILVGGTLNMAIVTVGPMVVPPPEGVDMTDMASLKDNVKLLQPVHFIAPWLAHALGTLVGAFVAAKIAVSHHLKLALGIGVFFLLGGIAVVVMMGGPIWFAVLDLLLAYLPMGYLGGKLAGGDHSGPVPQPAGQV